MRSKCTEIAVVLKSYVAVNKVIACLIPYLKIPLIIGDFIFAMSAYFSIFIVLNVNRVAVGVAVVLHFSVALWGCSRVARFLGLCGKLCFLNYAIIYFREDM